MIMRTAEESVREPNDLEDIRVRYHHVVDEPGMPVARSGSQPR
jgi:hypothetical protein